MSSISRSDADDDELLTGNHHIRSSTTVAIYHLSSINRKQLKKFLIFSFLLAIISISDLSVTIKNNKLQYKEDHAIINLWPAAAINSIGINIIQPTAAESYGDSSSAFNEEDDDDENDGLDSAATNEYADDQDQDQDRDQDHDDHEERDSADSNRQDHWLKTSPSPSNLMMMIPEESLRRPIWGSHLDGWRGRDKRDIEDSIRLHSSRRMINGRNRNRRSGSGSGQNKEQNAEEEFNVDDGDEDAWVHDGIDDIHIDPETKKAASELSSSMTEDDKLSNIDSEYEPQQQQQIVNRTRVTTISEVIPIQQTEAGSSIDMMGRRSLINDDDNDNDDSSESTNLNTRYISSPVGGTNRVVHRSNDDDDDYLPAAYLTFDQARQLADQHQPATINVSI